MTLAIGEGFLKTLVRKKGKYRHKVSQMLHKIFVIQM